ncbi:MAG: hypothetical protein IJS33_03285 [Firmicutes bacterium]|nr:hypothetical protein [Bacillota bacterium]
MEHAKFGVGNVTDITESTVTVSFPSVGIKKLAKGIAPIKKIQLNLQQGIYNRDGSTCK